MGIEIIKAGEWLVKEGETPHFSIYKLIQGKISVYSGSKKIRDMEINEDLPPIMPGITAVLGAANKHTASVKAETDVKVMKIPVDHISRLLKYEVSDSVKKDISVMTKTIAHGNEIIKQLNKFSSLPSVELDVPNDLSSDAVFVLNEIKRLYELVTKDVALVTSVK